MSEALLLAGANLLSPMILCFALGLFAGLARSELTVPEAAAKALSIYLLFAIGFNGALPWPIMAWTAGLRQPCWAVCSRPSRCHSLPLPSCGQ